MRCERHHLHDFQPTGGREVRTTPGGARREIPATLSGCPSKMALRLMKTSKQWIRILAGCIVSLIANPGVAGAGPWMMVQGEAYFAVSAVWTEFDQVDLYDGSRKSVDAVRFLSTGVTVEYGLNDRFSLNGASPSERSSRDNFPTFTGLGDGRLGLKIGLLSESEGNPISLALQSEVKFPLSDYETDALHGFGDGQTDFESGLSLGRYFHEISGYFVVEGSVTFRRDEPANEWSGYFELGKTFDRSTTARVFLVWTESLRWGRSGVPRVLYFAGIERGSTVSTRGRGFREIRNRCWQAGRSS